MLVQIAMLVLCYREIKEWSKNVTQVQWSMCWDEKAVWSTRIEGRLSHTDCVALFHGMLNPHSVCCLLCMPMNDTAVPKCVGVNHTSDLAYLRTTQRGLMCVSIG